MSQIRGVVVGYVNFGDNNKIIKVLSEHGTLSLVARRARGGRGSLAALLELGNDLILDCRASKGGLPVVTDAELVVSSSAARRQLEGVALLTYGCELLSGLSPESSDCSRQIKLLRVAISVLREPIRCTWPLRVALEAKALTFAGLMPSLALCVRCQQVVEGVARFNHELGGVLHAECGAGVSVPRVDLLGMEALRRTPLSSVQDAEVKPLTSPWVLSDFAEHQLGGRLKSRSMFELIES